MHPITWALILNPLCVALVVWLRPRTALGAKRVPGKAPIDEPLHWIRWRPRIRTSAWIAGQVVVAGRNPGYVKDSE
jgi:hypothetical protein